MTSMRLQSCMNLRFGPIIDRAIMVADERKASDGERSEDAGYKAIRRLSCRAILVDCATDLAQAERQEFCARRILTDFTVEYVDHRLRRLPGNEFPEFKEAWP